ncbi:MAG TPA: 2-amino-4-hydroxy-6-hydroxymethyldihydropteridine diphosphokinase [Steroidobacteraceae bacterium]|jgi:2-amino-4-hydroxy-6-hydroxymethyldihydropteridine diphosphokinase|nr:2-amino-4-hydroxy-6-hydroxymethyldihydropteridine diphosphokinase [Steroidobacteraceae bacterium]
MNAVFVAMGSNIDPGARLQQAARALKQRFPGPRFSACYRNSAFGFEGADFLNAVAGFDTALPIGELLTVLRGIETQCGRGRADPKWGPRAIDLDLLLYGQAVEQGSDYTVPRPDLTRRAYMLGPLAELAPQWRYPPAGPTIAELWERFPRGEHALHRDALDLNAA